MTLERGSCIKEEAGRPDKSQRFFERPVLLLNQAMVILDLHCCTGFSYAGQLHYKPRVLAAVGGPLKEPSAIRKDIGAL